MKAFIFLLGTIFVVCMALTPEERRMAEKKILDECKDLVKATDDDVNVILDKKSPQTRNGKCLLKCAYEKIGIVVDGHFSIDAMKTLGAKELEKDPKALGILNEMIAECETVTDRDVCEHSTKMMDCMVKAGIKRGIDPKKGIQESIGSI